MEMDRIIFGELFQRFRTQEDPATNIFSSKEGDGQERWGVGLDVILFSFVTMKPWFLS